MAFKPYRLPNHTLLHFYENLVLPRLVEEKMLILLKQGKITKWFSGIGQEVISVAATLALEKDEWILPLHRNLGVFTTRNISLTKLFNQFQGKFDGFSKGRDRSFHFGSVEHHICGMISHLGPQMAVADGIALAHKLKKQNKATLVFTGEGATSEGDFHESLNLAAVWDLPVIFLVENNGYSLSTPINEQFKIKSFTEKGAGYGIATRKIDGNNLLEVYETIKMAADTIRDRPSPILIEAVTFRMRGHEEGSGTSYVPNELFDKWAAKDPISLFEKYLLEEAQIEYSELESIKVKVQKTIDSAIENSFTLENHTFSIEEELKDIYAESIFIKKEFIQEPNREIRFVDAITEAIDMAMEADENLILMGQDIAEYGGVFKVTEGLYKKYSKDRVRNTPLCESAIFGATLGLAIENIPSIVEVQFADFVTSGFNQIVNNLAKIHYRWGQKCPVVIRMPTGAGVGAGPFHSQSTEAWFFKVPGLKIVYPSDAFSAKGLLLAAIKDPNPVLFFEHKKLYRSQKSKVPVEYYELEIGKAKVIKEGTDLSIITYGYGLVWALEAVEQFKKNSIEIIDLCSLQPWDHDTVLKSVMKTGKALIFHEDTLTGGISGEIASYISENAFQFLDAPVCRVGSLDTPVPFAHELEQLFLPTKRIIDKINYLINY